MVYGDRLDLKIHFGPIVQQNLPSVDGRAVDLRPYPRTEHLNYPGAENPNSAESVARLLLGQATSLLDRYDCLSQENDLLRRELKLSVPVSLDRAEENPVMIDSPWERTYSGNLDPALFLWRFRTALGNLPRDASEQLRRDYSEFLDLGDKICYFVDRDTRSSQPIVGRGLGTIKTTTIMGSSVEDTLTTLVAIYSRANEIEEAFSRQEK